MSFQVPGVTRIPLTPSEQFGEEWIEVKNGLNAGEDRQMISLAFKPVRLEDGSVVDRRDLSQWEFLRAQMWISNWHLHDPQGAVAPLTLASLKALEPDRFSEIDDAVHAHVVKVEMERAKKKMMRMNKPNADSTLPS